MSAITTSIDIDRAANEVYGFATDPTRFREWQQGVVDAHMDPAEAPQVGTQCHTTRRIGFADRVSTSEVTHVEPPRRWGVRAIDGPIRAIVDVTVDATSATRSRLTIAVDFEGHGIGKVLVPLVVRRAAQKEMPANLAALKGILEGGPSA